MKAYLSVLGLIMPTAMFVYMGSAARDLNDIFENPTNQVCTSILRIVLSGEGMYLKSEKMQGSMVLLSIGAMTVFSALLAGRIAAKAIQQVWFVPKLCFDSK